MGSLGLWLLFTAWVPLIPAVWTPKLDLGKMTGYTGEAGLRFLFLVVGLFLFYAAAARLTRRGGGLPFVLGGTALFSFVLLLAYPASAIDVFGYIAHGRMLAAGANPLVQVPSAHLPPNMTQYLAYPDEASQYGPVWVLLGGHAARLLGGDLLREVLFYKALASVAHVLSTVLVWLTARALTTDARQGLLGALLFGWNPLLLWEAAGNAHNDGFMALFLLLGLYFLVRGEVLGTLPAVAMGSLVKVPAIGAFPFLLPYLLRTNRVYTLVGLGLSAALWVAWYAPFWVGPATVTALSRGGLFTASLGGLVRLQLLPPLGETLATTAARAITTGLFALVLVPLLQHAWSARRPQPAIESVYGALMALALVAVTWFQAWYVVWVFAPAACLPGWSRRAEVAALSLGAFLHYGIFVYLWVGFLPGQSALVQHLAVLTVLGPLLLLWGARAARALRHVRRRLPWRPVATAGERA